MNSVNQVNIVEVTHAERVNSHAYLRRRLLWISRRIDLFRSSIRLLPLFIIAAIFMRDFSHPLLAVRPVRKRAVILIAADKGLCGSLNSNLFRIASEFDPQSTLFITAGRRAAQFIARSRRQLVAEFAYADTPQFLEARAIAAFARDLFLKEEVDQVQIVATRFINTLSQEPVSIEFLPVGEIKALTIPGAEPEAKLAADTTETLFEPNPQAVLGYLLSHYLDIYIYQVLLNAKASEQSARMTPNTIMATVSAVNPVYVDFSIAEQDYLRFARDKNGRGGDIELILGDGTAYPKRGHTLLVNREIDSRTGTIQVRAEFPNPTNVLRPGQYARIRSKTEVRRDALLIPQRAVAELQGIYQVGVVDSENKVTIRAVKPGPQFGDMWVIESGLQPGDKVVVDGLQRLRDGMIVSPTDFKDTQANAVHGGE